MQCHAPNPNQTYSVSVSLFRFRFFTDRFGSVQFGRSVFGFSITPLGTARGPHFEIGGSSSTPLKDNSYYNLDGSGWFIPGISIPFDPVLMEETKKKGIEKIVPEYYFHASQVFFSFGMVTDIFPFVYFLS